MTKPKRASSIAEKVAEAESDLDGTETPLRPTDAPPAPGCGDAILYTTESGAGPWPGVVTRVDGDEVTATITKPSKLTCAVSATMGDGPGTFALVD